MKNMFIALLFLLSACGSSTQAEDHMPKEWPWHGINMASTSAVNELDRIQPQNIKHVFLDIQPSRMGGMPAAIEWLNAALDRCADLEMVCSVRFDDVQQSAAYWADPVAVDALVAQIEELVVATGSRRVGHWAFMSEPNAIIGGRAYQPATWPSTFTRLLVMLRQYRPTDWVSYSPGPYASASSFVNLPAPFADTRIIYNMHGFLPHPYTHQGIYAQYPYGVKWPGVPYPGSPYPVQAGTWDKARLRESVALVRNFQIAHNVPVMVGSFSAARWAPDAEQFLIDAADIFREYDWSYAYWCYDCYHGWNPDYDATFDPINYRQQYIGLNSTRWNTLRAILD